VPKLRNETPFVAELVPMIDRSGSSVGVVIVKATFEFTEDGSLAVAPVQIPIAFTDVPVVPSTESDSWIPSDLVDHKPFVDVILLAPLNGLSRSVLVGREIALTLGPVRVAGKVGSVWTFGPLRRDQPSRNRFAGTYDEKWIEERMPLLPEDFDPRFNQVAPSAQIVPSLSGDEFLTLINVYGAGSTIRSRLPGKAIIIAGSVLSYYFTQVAVLDTVAISTDRPELTMVWRYAIRPRQKIEEIGRVYVYVARLRTARELYGVA
jgi:hypothetical protein